MPPVYTPVPLAGRSGTTSRTAIGASALPSPIPIPTPHVSSTITQAPGASARRTPNVPISKRPSVIARRVPIRAARYAATGAKSPMHSTGIVPSIPTTTCGASRSSSIAGKSGPTPTICGRSANAARKRPMRAAWRGCLTVVRRSPAGRPPIAASAGRVGGDRPPVGRSTRRASSPLDLPSRASGIAPPRRSGSGARPRPRARRRSGRA